MKPVEGSIRSRLSRLMFRGSLVLLVLTLAYWAFAAKFGANFCAVSADDKFPTGALALPGKHHELAWFVDSHAFLIWHVSDPAGGTLPLAKPYGLLGGLFGHLNWSPDADQSNHGFVLGSVITFRTSSKATTTAVTVRVLYLPFLRIVPLMAAWPLIVGVGRLWRVSRHAWSARRVRRIRAIRTNLGRCVCGYDLRSSQSRCPECGVPFRRIPVSMPSLKPGRRVLTN